MGDIYKEIYGRVQFYRCTKFADLNLCSYLHRSEFRRNHSSNVISKTFEILLMESPSYLLVENVMFQLICFNC